MKFDRSDPTARSASTSLTTTTGGARAVLPLRDLTPRELAPHVGDDAPLTLLDVREPVEWRIARLPGARLVPLATLPEVAPTLDPDADLVVYCHHGARSDAARALRDTWTGRLPSVADDGRLGAN